LCPNFFLGPNGEPGGFGSSFGAFGRPERENLLRGPNGEFSILDAPLPCEAFGAGGVGGLLLSALEDFPSLLEPFDFFNLNPDFFTLFPDKAIFI